MRKFNGLYVNELVKILKRPIVFITAGISVLFIIFLTLSERASFLEGLTYYQYSVYQGTLGVISILKNAGNIIIVLMIILSSGAISSEMSSGTIKKLLVSPVKRWQVFAAKLTALVTVSVAFTILLFIVTALTTGLTWNYYFESGNWNPAFKMLSSLILNSLSARTLLFVLWENFEIFTYIIFTLMLSIIIKKASVNVGISMVYFFVGNFFIASSLPNFIQYTTLLPFDKFIFINSLFTYNLYFNLFSRSAYDLLLRSAFIYSFVYMILFVVVILGISLCVFNRRDIK